MPWGLGLSRRGTKRELRIADQNAVLFAPHRLMPAMLKWRTVAPGVPDNPGITSFQSFREASPISTAVACFRALTDHQDASRTNTRIVHEDLTELIVILA